MVVLLNVRPYKGAYINLYETQLCGVYLQVSDPIKGHIKHMNQNPLDMD